MKNNLRTVEKKNEMEMKFARCEQSFQCQVIAVSGKAKAEGDYLKSIGASQVNKEQ